MSFSEVSRLVREKLTRVATHGTADPLLSEGDPSSCPAKLVGQWGGSEMGGHTGDTLLSLLR